MRRRESTSPEAGAAAVIWDVDGTLVDSLECHWQSWREALARRDYVLTRKQFESIIGQKMDSALRVLFKRDLPLHEIQHLEEVKENRCRALMRAGGLRLLPGVGRWLTYLDRAGWRQGIASSAPRLNLEVMLGTLKLERYFEAIVCAEDVREGKPAPEPFLRAAALLGIDPSRCIVVEDAAPGVEGARRAGMRTIGVGPGHALLQADVTARSLDELPDDTFDTLLSPAPS